MAEVINRISINTQQVAWNLYRQNRFDDALSIYQQNPQFLRTNSWFTHDYARTLVAIGDEQNVNLAVTELERLQRNLPNDAQIHASLALAYGRAGKYQRSLYMYEQALRLDPNNFEARVISPIDTDPKERAHRLHDQARQFLAQKNPLEALRYYEAAVALAGEAIGAWSIHDKGLALTQLGLNKEALNAFLKAEKYLPDITSIDFDITQAANRQTAFIESRNRLYPYTEPVIHKQVFSDQRGRRRLDGRNIESCTISSGIIALARMGIIPQNEALMNQLEEEAVRNALAQGYVPQGSAGMFISVTDSLFKNFNLKSGFARNQGEMLAALKAGGCVCSSDGHMRTITELSPDNQSFKIFDPIFAETSEIWPIARLTDISRDSAIVVYPPQYQTNQKRGETFTPNVYGIRPQLIANSTRYRLY